MNYMNVFYTRKSLIDAINLEKSLDKSIGFVPSMGALHEGHLALVKEALKEVDRVVVSIFVNPTQFNNSGDLETYPRMLETDINLLKTIGDVMIFAPDYSEVYPENDEYKPFDMDGLDRVLEGKFRSGHFEGVAHVVWNLFQIVQPDKAFFGLKDFQQVAVIKRMVKKLKLPTEIIACPTRRNKSGLALSSRNLRLSAEQQEDALIIYKTLSFVKNLKPEFTPREARAKAIEFFNKGKLELEYLEIVEDETLTSLSERWEKNSTCCIAAFCGEVRLIDNIQFK
jgi:pantoate--beta-alanine ligase